MSFIKDFCSSLFLLGVMIISFVGWGNLLARLLRIATPLRSRFFMYFWLGISVVIFLLQLLHLIRPIQWVESILIFGLGVCVFFRKFSHRSPGLFGRSIRAPVPALMIGVLLCLAVVKGMQPPTHFDCGLYYFTSIRWINEYSIVPGLANLLVHLGFNQTHFQLAAALNFYPFYNHGYAVMSSGIFLVWLLQVLHSIRFSNFLHWTPSHIVTLYSMFLFPIVLLMFMGSDLASPRADSICFILQLVIFQYVILSIFLSRNLRWRMGSAQMVLPLACAIVTIKLSSIVFSVSCICLVFFATCLTIRNRLLSLRRFTPVLAFCMGLMLLYAVRGYIISGYPLYPSTLFGMDFDWSRSNEDTRHHATVIREWARIPRQPVYSVIDTWTWVLPWARRTFADNTFVVPMIVALGSWMVLLIGNVRRRIAGRGAGIGGFRELGLLTAPLVFSLAFWFYSAPEPRFAGGLMWLMAVVPFVAIFSWLSDSTFKLFCNVRPLFCFTLIIASSLRLIHLAPRLSAGYPVLPSPPLKQVANVHGVLVNIPVIGDQVWNAPLPAAPDLSDKLGLRGRNLRSGFTIKEDKSVLH
jgi:hypothetical protein